MAESGVWLGQYQLLDVIRRGPMSTIYKASQPSLDRFVAVKVLNNIGDPSFIARFQLEARSIARLAHPNILPVYDYGEQDGYLYLVAQYIEGGATLIDSVGDAAMEPVAALTLAGRVLDGLEHAHRQGVVHRDVKPANILITPEGWPLLADFGIAKLLAGTQDPGLTQVGFIVGTAAYIAPEQALGRPVDARTDVYAMGVVLYEMLTGQVPFVADTPTAALARHAYEPPPPPRSINAALAEPVEEMLLRALEKDPGRRHQSAAELRGALDRLIDELRPRSAPQADTTSLYATAVDAFDDGEWALAISRLEGVLRVQPDHDDASELLIAAREARGHDTAGGETPTLQPSALEPVASADLEALDAPPPVAAPWTPPPPAPEAAPLPEAAAPPPFAFRPSAVFVPEPAAEEAEDEPAAAHEDSGEAAKPAAVRQASAETPTPAAAEPGQAADWTPVAVRLSPHPSGPLPMVGSDPHADTGPVGRGVKTGDAASPFPVVTARTRHRPAAAGKGSDGRGGRLAVAAAAVFVALLLIFVMVRIATGGGGGGSVAPASDQTVPAPSSPGTAP